MPGFSSQRRQRTAPPLADIASFEFTIIVGSLLPFYLLLPVYNSFLNITGKFIYIALPV